MDTTQEYDYEEPHGIAEALMREICTHLETLTGVSCVDDDDDNIFTEITLPLQTPGGWKVEMTAEKNVGGFVVRGYDPGKDERFEINMDDAAERFLWRQLYHHSFRCTPEDGLTAVCTRDTLAETACRFGALMQAIAFCRYYNK